MVEIEAEVAGMGDEVGICSTSEGSGESDTVELGTFESACGTQIARTGSSRAVKAIEAFAFPTTTLMSCVGGPLF